MIVAINKDLVMSIIDTFVSKGSTVDTITPSFMYGKNANFSAGLTLDSVRAIMGNMDTLRLGNLLTDQEKIIPSQNLKSELSSPPAGSKPDLTNEIKKPKNLRQYVLIGVFVILLIILGIVYYLTSSASQAPPVKKTKNTTNASKVVPTPAQESTTPVPIDLKKVNLSISHSAQSQGIVADLKIGLSEIGFENIRDEVSESLTPEKSSIIFSQSIPADLRNNIIVQMKKTLPAISILESQDSDFTIRIILGKS